MPVSAAEPEDGRNGNIDQPVTAAVTPKAADGADISTIGSFRITSITDENGRKYNGILPDGTKVTDGVDASYASAQIVFGFHGRIDNIGSLNEDDKVIVPVAFGQAYSHFSLNYSNIGGPAVLSDDSGRPIFTVAWGGNPNLITLTRTNTVAAGSYEFDLTTTPLKNWWNTLSDEALNATTSTWTIGGQTFTINNISVPASAKTISPCRFDYQLNQYQDNSMQTAFTIVNQLSACSDLNDTMAGQYQQRIEGDVIRVYRIKPDQGEIANATMTSWNIGWVKPYDSTTMGSTQGLYTYYRMVKGATKVSDKVTTLDEARATLAANQYAITMDTDGSIIIAVNMGPRQGANAVLSTGVTAPDATTQTIIDKANAAKVGPRMLRSTILVTIKDPSKEFRGVATVDTWINGRQETSTFNVNNTLGSSSGQGQSTVRLDPNGADGTMADIYGNPGSKLNLPAVTFVRDGYQFTGWNSKQDGSGTILQDKGEVTFGNEGTVQTWYAQWKLLPVTIACAPSTGDPAASVWQVASVFGALVCVGLGAFIVRFKRRFRV